jgi:hypothetical protein
MIKTIFWLENNCVVAEERGGRKRILIERDRK